MEPFDELELSDYALDDSITRRLTSPALVIDLAKVRANIRRVLECVGGPDSWRPHVKTTKSPRVWRELVDRGVRQFKCATAREARALAETLRECDPRGGDVLLAHPAIGPTLERLGGFALEFPETRFSVISEDPEHVAQVPESVGVFVDVDPGYLRTGLNVRDHDLALSVAKAAGIRFRGVHYYEGQHTELDRDTRQEAAFSGYREVLELLARLTAAGIPVGELVTSGTPGFLCALAFPGFKDLGDTRHRVSPGTVVFHDWRSQSQIPELGLQPAAVVFTRVISQPGENRFTCDAGSKSIAAEAGHPCAYVIGSDNYLAQVPSEEHLPVTLTKGDVPARGTQLYLVPKHVCPTVNLAEEAVLVDGRELLGLIAIRARAHDTLIPVEGEPVKRIT